MKNQFLLSCVCVTFATAIAQNNKPKMVEIITAPLATVKPKQIEKHGHVRTDDYYWLNERENPEVIDYLNKENDYYNKMTEHTKQFQADLFEEMKSRIKEDDSSVPYLYNGYYYITRFEKGKDYQSMPEKKGVWMPMRKSCSIAMKWPKDSLIFN